MRRLLLILVAALCFAACSNGQKTLVVYYSQSNTTKTVAQEIQKQLGCDIAEIECVEPFTGDFGAVAQRWQKEQQEGKTTAIKPLSKNLKDYDVIFLGYPIWGGTYASPVASFLKDADFQGKKVVPFCSFGSGGLNTSIDALKKNAKNANIVDGYGIRQARISKVSGEVEQFLISAGFKKGNAVKLPDFSAQKAVTDKEKEIFQKACSSYQFPLGTPSTVGSRKVAKGTEYLFTVDGQMGSSKIYVIAEDGAEPEFTQVVR